MTWNFQKTKERIKAHISSVPTFDPQLTLAGHGYRVRQSLREGIFDYLSSKVAFPVEGAHLYGLLLDFDKVVSDNGAETESSHRQMLQFLHVFYRVWDSVVANDEGHRVDYHGARMHVVLTGSYSAKQQIERAIALASKLTEAAKRVGNAFGFPSRIRFGIDYGHCVAMTTGRAHDRDTLFLGSPANHAAKKVSESDEPGIFLADNAIQIIGQQVYQRLPSGRLWLNEAFVRKFADTYKFEGSDHAIDALVAESKGRSARASFSFFRPTPPLVRTKFTDLAPAHTARAGMACLFADIDGFTAYVDHAMRMGETAIRDAVTTIHVLREELNAVLQGDFGGKRIRFIGDCIEGGFISGHSEDIPEQAITDSALCAAAMRTSFDLCLESVQPSASLDLAIGIEYGPTPLTRLGTRGEHSVRCAAGRALVAAERLQQSISGGGIRFGQAALLFAPASVRRHFAESTRIIGFPDAADLLAAPDSPIVSVVKSRSDARPHSRQDKGDCL